MQKIKRLSMKQLEDAVILANKACYADVFSAYTDEGKGNMMRYMLKKADILASQIENGYRTAYGLFDNDQLCGMMVIQNKSHIALLYVDTAFRKKGYGKALICYAMGYASAFNKPVLTVDASDYGLLFYAKCGFKPTGFRTVDDGISYTPMRLILQ